jgi:hypothetical protein
LSCRDDCSHRARRRWGPCASVERGRVSGCDGPLVSVDWSELGNSKPSIDLRKASRIQHRTEKRFPQDCAAVSGKKARGQLGAEREEPQLTDEGLDWCRP